MDLVLVGLGVVLSVSVLLNVILGVMVWGTVLGLARPYTDTLHRIEQMQNMHSTLYDRVRPMLGEWEAARSDDSDT